MLNTCRAGAVLADDAGAVMPDVPHVSVPQLSSGHPARGAVGHRSAGADGAYIVFTSGSTGKPKGVLIEQHSLQNLFDWTVRFFHARPGRRSSMNVSVGFDASVWEIWCTLPAGVALFIPPERTRLSPTALRRWLLDHRVHFCFVPTRMGEALLQQAWPKDTTLEKLIVGGEQLCRFSTPGVPFDVVNVYGPSEATVYTTYEVVERRDDPSGCPPIGRPLDRVRVYVLDGQGQPVRPGGIGELYIGGAGVGRGYVNRPDLSAERFVLGPDGDSTYRSGDLVSQLPDGRLLFHGRRDDQVKVGGARVEIGEVEAAIARHPYIRGVGVVAWPSHAGPRLGAYVELHDWTAATGDDLRAWTAGHLPAHMVPNVFVVMDHLPTNRNGKLNRDRLPKPRWALTVRSAQKNG